MKYPHHSSNFLFSSKVLISLVTILIIILAFLHSSTSAQACTNLYQVGDMIWYDANTNGVQDIGEDGIPNVVMQLLDDYGNALFTTTTGSEPISGQYTFEVEPGKYTVRVAPENFTPGGVLEGFTPTADFNGDGVGENEYTQSVSCRDILTFDFGYWHPQADLVVTKTDGVTEVDANSSTIYAVRVTNNGPEPVTGATFLDTTGLGLTTTSVVCSSAPGNQCVSPPLLAELTSTGVSLPTLASGQFYEIELTALVTAASGSVTNTATITSPTGTTDPTPGNNTATDTDTVTSAPNQSADLAITKTDGVTTVNVNGSTSYTIKVINNGPDSVTGATLVDTAGVSLIATGVVCTSAPGNQCVSPPLLAELISTGIILPTLASGQFYEIDLTATVIAVTGLVPNIATVIPSTSITDPISGNNTATDTNILTLYHLYMPVINSQGSGTSTIIWNAVIGYEDLPMMTGQHDFDYNDWAVALNGTLAYTSPSSNLLKNFAMSFTPYTRGATYDHTFQIIIPAQTFASNGTAVINLYDQNHNFISKQVEPFFSSTDNVFVIFARTSEVFPGSNINTLEGIPLQPAQRFADLTITFDTPGFFIFSPNSLSQSHGQGLFFDPTLVELNKGEEIHRGDVRMLSLPIASWLWPEEGVRIDRAYPLVVYKPGNPSDFLFPSSWWIVHNHCIYDGLPCNAP